MVTTTQNLPPLSLSSDGIYDSNHYCHSSAVAHPRHPTLASLSKSYDHSNINRFINVDINHNKKYDYSRNFHKYHQKNQGNLNLRHQQPEGYCQYYQQKKQPSRNSSIKPSVFCFSSSAVGGDDLHYVADTNVSAGATSLSLTSTSCISASWVSTSQSSSSNNITTITNKERTLLSSNRRIFTYNNNNASTALSSSKISYLHHKKKYSREKYNSSYMYKHQATISQETPVISVVADMAAATVTTKTSATIATSPAIAAAENTLGHTTNIGSSSAASTKNSVTKFMKTTSMEPTATIKLSKTIQSKAIINSTMATIIAPSARAIYCRQQLQNKHYQKHQQHRNISGRFHFLPSLGATSCLTILTLICLETILLSTVSNCAKTFYMHWNTSNSIFRIDNTDHIIDVNKGNLAFEFDQVHIICPVYEPGTFENETEKYIIYNVSKVEYETCRITNADPRVIAICDKPQKLMFFTITFRPFTPQPGGLEFLPGNDYYFISTSSKDDLYRRIGGRCSTNNMKVVFKVCCALEEKNKTTTTSTSNGVSSGGGVTTISTSSTNSGNIDSGVDTINIIQPTNKNQHQQQLMNTIGGVVNTGLLPGHGININAANNIGGSGMHMMKPLNGQGGGIGGGGVIGGTAINTNIEQFNRIPMQTIGGGMIGGGIGLGTHGSNGIMLQPSAGGHGSINMIPTGVGGQYPGIGIVSGGIGSGGLGIHHPGQPQSGIRINNIASQQHQPTTHHKNSNIDGHQHFGKHPNEVVKNEELTYNGASAVARAAIHRRFHYLDDGAGDAVALLALHLRHYLNIAIGNGLNVIINCSSNSSMWTWSYNWWWIDSSCNNSNIADDNGVYNFHATNLLLSLKYKKIIYNEDNNDDKCHYHQEKRQEQFDYKKKNIYKKIIDVIVVWYYAILNCNPIILIYTLIVILIHNYLINNNMLSIISSAALNNNNDDDSNDKLINNYKNIKNKSNSLEQNRRKPVAANQENDFSNIFLGNDNTAVLTLPVVLSSTTTSLLSSSVSQSLTSCHIPSFSMNNYYNNGEIPIVTTTARESFYELTELLVGIHGNGSNNSRNSCKNQPR